MQTNELRHHRLRSGLIALALALSALIFVIASPRMAFAADEESGAAVPGANGSYGTSSLFADEGAHEAAREHRRSSASGNAQLLGAILGEIAKSSDTVYEQQAAAEEAAREENVRASVADIALGLLGVPYVSGGTTPAGFDCSGLVRYCVLQACGWELPRTAVGQSAMGHSVSFSELQPGDLLFWGGAGGAWHVAISLGGDSYVHAPAPGQSVSVGTFQYFTPSFARRLSF